MMLTWPVQDTKTQPSLKELLLAPTTTDLEIPERGTHSRRKIEPSVTQNHHLLIDNNMG